MASVNPQLIKQTALAKATQLESRVNALVNSSTTELSPVVVYLEGAVSELSVHGDVSAAGTWTCPAGITQVQVECYGAGGGGGGGKTTSGGGGGGGGEYACEPTYAVVPGNVYTFAVGRAGQGGICAGQGGWDGGDTVFDTAAVSDTGGGVIAHGGGGGDGPSQLNGGTGSTNTIHFDGGAGGVSSAGIASDNAVVGTGSVLSGGNYTKIGMWWVFKGANTSNGALSSIYDDSLRSHTGTVVNREISGLKSAVISTTGAPPQTSGSGGNCAYFKQDLSSNTISYVTSPKFNWGNGYGAPYDGSVLTVSCWIKSAPGATSWSYIPAVAGRNFAMLLSNCDVAAGFHTGGNDVNSSGYGLFLLDGVPGLYLNPSTRSTSSSKVASASSAVPLDGNWHQVAGTWDGTTIKVYVDGALAGSTGSTGFTKFGNGPFAHTAGANANTKADSGFCGYMSNLWIGGAAATSTYISQAYGSTPETGGSGGGASGGSAGTGNAGVSASSTTGAAGGAAAAGTGTQLGSGAGAAGGNANVSGSNAPVVSPYGGGGGGAGASTSAGSVTSLSVPCIQSASYCGFDAQGGNAGALYSISSMIQQGIANPYTGASLISSNVYVGGTPSTSFNGSMTGMVLFPKLLKQLSGFTVNSMSITFAVQSTNASVLPVWTVIPKAGQTELPATWGSATDITNYTSGTPTLVLEIPIPAGAAGRLINFDITNTALASSFTSGNLVALTFGGFQGEVTYDIGDGAYNDPDSFAWNTVLTGCGTNDISSNMTINFELYPSSASNKIGGDGAPGNLVVSYIDPRYWPVVAIEPAATTDANNHSFATGITTDSIVGFDPTVITPPRVPETWHSLGSLASGSGLTISDARYRYSPVDGGTVVIEVNVYVPNGASLVTGEYGFANHLSGACTPSCSSTAAQDLFAIPTGYARVSTPAAAVGLVAGMVYGQNSSIPGKVSLLVTATETASGNSWATMVARLPLT